MLLACALLSRKRQHQRAALLHLGKQQTRKMPPRNPSVIAYHLCWTAYGVWMPNDPRGSGSREVATLQIAELGELHYGRKRVQPPPAIVREFQQAAEELLKYSAIRFDSQHVDAIAEAFAETIAEETYTCYACAVMPDHAHLVIRKHLHRAEKMIDLLQEASRLRLSSDKLIPREHPCWTSGGWHGFLDSPAAVCRAIRYVENNSVKAGLPAQTWGFVTPYDGWPYHKRIK